MGKAIMDNENRRGRNIPVIRREVSANNTIQSIWSIDQTVLISEGDHFQEEGEMKLCPRLAKFPFSPLLGAVIKS